MALSPTDLSALSRLLDTALELVPAQLDPWLAALPPEVAHLVPRLRQMLDESHHRRELDRLEQGPRWPNDTNDGSVAHAGELVGPYRLIRELGRGGMGAVWLAERVDGRLNRKVALKLPRLAWDAGLAERMARERDIGALLEHPNIARLYDASIDEHGRPFLALEYVDGQALDTWCDARQLDIPGRLRLFLQVARAVAYAHGRLVVHRDLKPANVLVTEDGQAHLLDFGIAKLMREGAAVEETLTVAMGRVMTPHYASPEQLAGGQAITVASDVYSLGAMLFKLLTGHTPYAGTTLGAIEQALASGEPELASSQAKNKALAKQLSGDLDAILAKSLRREPAQRYATADALASDIERHLGGDAVLAQPDSVGYRLRKVIWRYRWALAGVSTITLTALAGAGASLVQAAKANEAAERARVVKDYVVDVFKVTDPRNRETDELRQMPLEVVLERGADLIETKFEDRPDLQAELYGVVSGIFANVSNAFLTEKYARRQIRALKSHGVSNEQLANALVSLARSLEFQRRYKEAKESIEEACQLLPEHSTLHGLAHLTKIRILIHAGEYNEARLEIHRLISMQGVANEISAAAVGYQAWILVQEGELNESEGLFRTAIKLATESAGEHSAELYLIRIRFAFLLSTKKNFGEALEQLGLGVSEQRAAGGQEVMFAALNEASVVGQIFEENGVPFSYANPIIQKDLEILESYGNQIPQSNLSTIEGQLANMNLAWGDLAEAKKMATAARKHWGVEDGIAHLSYILGAAGQIEIEIGNHEQASDLLEQHLTLRKEAYTSNPDIVLPAYAFLARNYRMQGRLSEAEAMISEAHAPPGSIAPGDNTNARYLNAERALIALDRLDPAAALRALADGAIGDTEAPQMAADSLIRGRAYCQLGRRAEGLALMEDEIQRILVPSFWEHSPTLIYWRAVAGQCALAAGQRKHAAELARLARTSLEINPAINAYHQKPLKDLLQSLRRSGVRV